MNRQQILSRLGQKYRLLYSNGLLHPWQIKNTGICRLSWCSSYSESDQVTQHKAGLFPFRSRSTFIDFIMLKILAYQWRRRLNWNSKLDIAYVFGPAFVDYLKFIKHGVLVYHVYDDFKGFPGWSSEEEERHRWMLESADLVIASSQAIARGILQYGSFNPVVVENGVDFESFSSTGLKSPVEYQNISGPIIAYVGTINRKVDLGLILRLASREPRWNWVFIGRVGSLDRPTKAAYDSLKSLSRVHFLGEKPVEQLPSYVNFSSVNIMNYAMDDGMWFKSGYPLKMNEYLATGKPIVSSDLESVRPYSDVIHIAKNDDEWHQSIAASLRENSAHLQSKRRQIAKTNSWDNKIEKIDKLILAASGRV